MFSGRKLKKEIAAGAGVGVGVLGQEKPEEEEDEKTDGDDTEKEEKPGEESGGSGNNEKEQEEPKKESRIMKIKRADLQEMVKTIVSRKLHELVDRDSVPGKDGELGKYAGKFDKFLSDSIDTANELIEEAEKMMRENLLNHPTVGERNRALMSRVGIIKNLKAKLLEIMEATHRSM